VPVGGPVKPTRRAAVVIPARLGSRRFPRKVLAKETGKYLVQHVWERLVGCPGVSRVIIATDSDEVLTAARSFGAEAVMTSPDHLSGTDRVAEVARELTDDYIINVQGDEPLIAHDDLILLLGLFESPAAAAGAGAEVVMTTLVSRRSDPDGFSDPNVVKAVLARDGRALYFSRSPVPYPPLPAASREGGGEAAGPELLWWQHIGIYAYRRDFLLRLARLEPTPLEKRERLEQLRVLEHGYTIRAGEASGRHLGIDTLEEYRQFVAEVARGKEKK
jgi:3-deoxy-manno-octulosonate cytidylyltransferase (CMP-KDO synthetase)